MHICIKIAAVKIITLERYSQCISILENYFFDTFYQYEDTRIYADIYTHPYIQGDS